MFNPCYEHCYLRYGKSYTADCDDKCAYAKAMKNREVVTVDTFDRDKNEFVVMKYRLGKISNDELCSIHKTFCETFPDSKIIAIPDDISIESCDKKTLVCIYETIKKELETKKKGISE